MELSRLVLRKLKMPEMTANPLIVRSFAAHRKVPDHQDLLTELKTIKNDNGQAGE